ncbi:1,4-alpha-glucan branching enzyme [Deferribacterales bacterium]|nr:1,4-alpha-glucan branching enzyme [Deferribacterales bacterium]
MWSSDDVYRFKNDKKAKWTDFPRIYEAHIGIAQPYIGRTDKSVGTFEMFSKLLPRIKESGYTAVQLMGVLEHLLYKSFGYQVSSYFATSSRFGSPDDFKRLVDEAHRLGLSVILDIPHSHSVPNTEQGIARYDTTSFLFADKANQWGTISFDFCKEMTRRFLLSNCRYWMEEYHIDGFRFDAVGNMIYLDNGINDSFSDVNSCFYSSNGSSRIDEAGVLYLELANELIHSMGGVSIAEEFSGMPGMTSRACEGGLAFDYRLAMGIPDFWGKFIKKGRTSSDIWYEMTNRRGYERTISYVACHDQSINGHDAMIWRLIGDDMYEYMSHLQTSWKASRGIALYKMMRLVTLGTADAGYLSFMGDEFGHPEWIDADGYGHRQWHLTARNDIKYGNLWAFDKASLVDLLAKHADSFREKPYMRYVHDEYRILAFERGRLLFVFNFNETEAVENLSLWVTPGKYVEMLSSDSKLFAGNGNLEISNPQMEHFSQTDDSNSDKSVERISLYLPPLVVLVMLRS